MARRNSKQHVTRFFYPSNPYDPIDNIFSEIGNQLATLGMRKFSAMLSSRLGLAGVSPENELALNRSRVSLAMAKCNWRR